MKVFIVHDGKTRQQVDDYLAEQTSTKKVTVSGVRSKRSLSQNGLYQIWLKQMGQVWGYAGKDELEYLSEELLKLLTDTKHIRILGKTREVPVKTTSQMTIEEMQEYMELVLRFASTQGIVLETQK
jgi:hypothetical protein